MHVDYILYVLLLLLLFYYNNLIIVVGNLMVYVFFLRSECCYRTGVGMFVKIRLTFCRILIMT